MPRSFLPALLGLSLALAYAAPSYGAVGPRPVPKAARASRASVGGADLRSGSRPARAGRRGGHRGKMKGRVVSESELRPTPLPRPSGNLRIHSLNYDEELKTNIYNPDGSYSVEAARQTAHVFRCKRTREEHEIDPRLLTILSHVYDRFGGRPLELLSGYRYQRKTTSNHFHGAAADIRILGVRPRDLRTFVHTLDAGGMGVGFYPRVGFVHIDVRPAPSFRWIDNARSNPDSWDKQPPRSWKRKKLES
jgi:uncharacterized protein YcbK (DUF882 family)